MSVRVSSERLLRLLRPTPAPSAVDVSKTNNGRFSSLSSSPLSRWCVPEQTKQELRALLLVFVCLYLLITRRESREVPNISPRDGSSLAGPRAIGKKGMSVRAHGTVLGSGRVAGESSIEKEAKDDAPRCASHDRFIVGTTIPRRHRVIDGIFVTQKSYSLFCMQDWPSFFRCFEKVQDLMKYPFWPRFIAATTFLTVRHAGECLFAVRHPLLRRSTTLDRSS
jgi:hypothetical protein